MKRKASRPFVICLSGAISLFLITILFDVAYHLLGLSFWVPENPYSKNVHVYMHMQNTPDIVFLGSSVTTVGIDPAAIEKHLTETYNVEVEVYNLGVSGSSVDVTEMIAKYVLDKPKHPRLLVLCANIQWINSSRRNRRGRYLKYYARPVPILLDCLQPEILDSKFRNAAIYGFFRNTRILFRLPIISPWHDQEKSELHEIIDRKGYVPRTDRSTISKWTPKRHARMYRALKRRSNSTPFEAKGFCDRAFRNVISLCRTADTELIVIDMPVHPLFMKAFSNDEYLRYHQYLDSLCSKTKTPLFHLRSETMGLGHMHFYDYIHLSPEGSQIVSKSMADLLSDFLTS